MASRDQDRTPRSYRDLMNPRTPVTTTNPRRGLQQSRWAPRSTPANNNHNSQTAINGYDESSDEETTPRGRPLMKQTRSAPTATPNEPTRRQPLLRHKASSPEPHCRTFEQEHDGGGSNASSISMTNVPSWMSCGQILSAAGLSASSSAFSESQSSSQNAEIRNYDQPQSLYETQYSPKEGGVALSSTFRCTCLDNDSAPSTSSSDEESDEEMPGQGGASLRNEKKARKERLRLENKSCSCSPMRRQHEWEEQRRREQDILSPFPNFDADIAAELEETGDQYFLMPVRQVLLEERPRRHRR